jgi:hypothetical protein
MPAVRLLGSLWLVCVLTSLSGLAAETRGVLVSVEQLSTLDAKHLSQAGLNTLVVKASEGGKPDVDAVKQLQNVQAEGIEIALWIEVARDPALATEHPEWMASIQGHPEWRRFYPEFPELKEGQVVKVFPWVPIAYREAFAAQLQKVERILAEWPYAKRIFLNDLQGAPSACGCGHPLCRWTTDYGPIKTATALGADFAARFVQSVKALRADLDVVPVWATECEEGDKPGLCAGVGCYRGACWREWTAQLEPLAAESDTIGALLLESTFQRKDIGPSWLSEIGKTFQTMPERYQRAGVPVERLLAVIEGWQPDHGAGFVRQLGLLQKAGIESFVVAQTQIDQRWEPKVFNLLEK